MSPPTAPNPDSGGSRRCATWGARFFTHQVRHFEPSTPPAERRFVRCICTVFRMSDRMLDRMEDADVWRLARAVDQLKAAAADATAAGVDDCYVRTLMALAFLAAREVLERALDLIDPDELSLFRAQPNSRRETP